MIFAGYKQIVTALLTPFEAGFGPFERELTDLAQEIRDVISLVSKQAEQQERELQTNERYAAQAHRKLLVKLSDRAQRESESSRNVQLEVDRRKAEQHRQRLKDVLSTHNYQRAYNQLRKECMPRTSVWVYENPNLFQFIKGAAMALQLVGKRESSKLLPILQLTCRDSGLWKIRFEVRAIR